MCLRPRCLAGGTILGGCATFGGVAELCPLGQALEGDMAWVVCCLCVRHEPLWPSDPPPPLQSEGVSCDRSSQRSPSGNTLFHHQLLGHSQLLQKWGPWGLGVECWLCLSLRKWVDFVVSLCLSFPPSEAVMEMTYMGSCTRDARHGTASCT